MNAPSGLLAGLSALAFGAVAFVLAGAGTVGTVLGAIGLSAVVLGLVGRHRRSVTAGAALLYGEVLLAGSLGLPTASTVAAGASVLCCLTFGRAAVDVGLDVPDGETRRLEAAHVVGTGLLVAGAVAVSRLTSIFEAGTVPALAVALLALGAVALLAAVRA